MFHKTSIQFKYIQELLYSMKINTKNTLLIVLLTTLITITPSVISSVAFSQTETTGIPRVTGEPIKKPAPSVPENDQPNYDTSQGRTGDSLLPNNPGVPEESDTTPDSEASDELDVAITSPEDGATIDAGTLTVSGTSTDTPNTDCQVYANWNEQPSQVVTPQSQGDYSTWTFTDTSAYNLIIPGETNELTVEISCGSSEGSDGSDDLDSASDSIEVIGG